MIKVNSHIHVLYMYITRLSVFTSSFLAVFCRTRPLSKADTSDQISNAAFADCTARSTSSSLALLHSHRTLPTKTENKTTHILFQCNQYKSIMLTIFYCTARPTSSCRALLHSCRTLPTVYKDRE